MSTKKKENPALIETQHNGVTMILEKKSNGNKAPTPEMQARMEAGKVEIMKVVEGVPGAEKLGELIERGKKKGNLSSTELMDVLEDMDLESDQMDKIYDTLETWASIPWARTISPTSPMTQIPLWRPWRRSTRRRWWTPTPWWTPSAPMTRYGCI